MNKNTRILSIIVVLLLITFVVFVATRTPAPAQHSSPTYSNTSLGFSLSLPQGYTTDESYIYQALGPGKDIAGVKFTISTSTSAGTNLSSDSYISVEEIPNASSCSASLFVSQGIVPQTVSDGKAIYSVASSSDAGAGNRYEETVYALPNSNPCTAIRYFVHYGAFENYPTGSIQQFDKNALMAQFDSIRRTLVVSR